MNVQLSIIYSRYSTYIWKKKSWNFCKIYFKLGQKDLYPLLLIASRFVATRGAHVSIKHFEIYKTLTAPSFVDHRICVQWQARKSIVVVWYPELIEFVSGKVSNNFFFRGFFLQTRADLWLSLKTYLWKCIFHTEIDLFWLFLSKMESKREKKNQRKR